MGKSLLSPYPILLSFNPVSIPLESAPQVSEHHVHIVVERDGVNVVLCGLPRQQYVHAAVEHWQDGAGERTRKQSDVRRRTIREQLVQHLLSRLLKLVMYDQDIRQQRRVRLGESDERAHLAEIFGRKLQLRESMERIHGIARRGHSVQAIDRFVDSVVGLGDHRDRFLLAGIIVRERTPGITRSLNDIFDDEAVHTALHRERERCLRNRVGGRFLLHIPQIRFDHIVGHLRFR